MDTKEKVKILSEHFKEDILEKYLNYYYTAKKLYLNVEIKQYKSLENIILQLSSEYYYRKEIKAIEKFERPKPIAKEFFIAATVERIAEYAGDKRKKLSNKR